MSRVVVTLAALVVVAAAGAFLVRLAIPDADGLLPFPRVISLLLAAVVALTGIGLVVVLRTALEERRTADAVAILVTLVLGGAGVGLAVFSLVPLAVVSSTAVLAGGRLLRR